MARAEDMHFNTAEESKIDHQQWTIHQLSLFLDHLLREVGGDNHREWEKYGVVTGYRIGNQGELYLHTEKQGQDSIKSDLVRLTIFLYQQARYR